MKRTLRNVILSLVVISSLFFSCQSNQDKTKLTEKVSEDTRRENTECGGTRNNSHCRKVIDACR